MQFGLTQSEDNPFAKARRINGKTEVPGSEMSTLSGTLWRKMQTWGKRRRGRSIGTD
jgi:hypothetical protein